MGVIATPKRSYLVVDVCRGVKLTAIHLRTVVILTPGLESESQESK